VTANGFYRLYMSGVEMGMEPEPNQAPLSYYDQYEILRRSRELTHRCSPKVDHLGRATMNGHARCPEETVPDLPAVVPARRESRRPPTQLQ
jgi:hypothetical protein